MKKLIALAICLVALASPTLAFAATCFWVPLAVSGAVSGTGGVCKLTVSAITGSGQLAGDTVNVSGITGATGCNVSTTISTVVSSTQIELSGTTFGGAYVSGGTVGGGHWNASNTTNWSNATGGSVGGCLATGGVPKNGSDSATLDANSGGGTFVADSGVGSFSATFNGFTMTNFTGTVDFSVSNTNFTLGNFVGGGGGSAATLKMGNGTWTVTGIFSTPWSASGTNFTIVPGSSTLVLGGSTATNTRNYSFGNGLSYNIVTISDGSPSSGLLQNFNGNSTIATLNLNGPMYIYFGQSTNTMTITNAVNWNPSGSSTSVLNLTSLSNNGALPKITLSAAGGTCKWCVIGNTTFQTNSLTATNSFDAKGNTLATISPPGGSGFGPMISAGN